MHCSKLPNPKSERDAMIAALAKVHGVNLKASKVKSSRHMDLDIVNP